MDRCDRAEVRRALACPAAPQSPGDTPAGRDGQRGPALAVLPRVASRILGAPKSLPLVDAPVDKRSRGQDLWI